MSRQPVSRPNGRYLGLVVISAIAVSTGWAFGVVAVQGRPADSWLAAGVRQAWQVLVPLNNVNHIRSWWLVDEYLYAFGTDGKVRAIGAATGEHLWTLPLVEPLASISPPVSYHTDGVRGVVFTVRDIALFLNPATGTTLTRPQVVEGGKTELRPVGPVHLWSGSINSVAVVEDTIFQAAPRKRIRKYSISRDIQTFQVGVDAEIMVAPLYVPSRDVVLMADANGTVGAVPSREREAVFTAELRGSPIGWLAADEHAAYVVTDEPRLHVLDLATGQEMLEGYPQGYVLPAMPAGGPVVTKDSVYVALQKGGVQRVGKELKWPNWVVPDARLFLAEWPGRVVLQRNDGRVMFVRPETGEPLGHIDPGKGFDGISNPRNEAVILTSARGEARCLRPADAGPLTAASFQPVTSRPASAPAAVAAAPEESPAEETEKPAEETTAAAPAQETGPKLSPIEALIADPLKSRR